MYAHSALKMTSSPPKLNSTNFLRLWGENFFNATTKKWAKQKDSDNKRSFCMYVLDPIYKVFDAIMNFRKEEIDGLIKKLGVTLKHEDSDKDGKALLKVRVQFIILAGQMAYCRRLDVCV